MSAYVIVDIEVTDPVGYEEYRRQAPPLITAYGGRYLARGGATELIEGTRLPQRVVILEFPSMEKFKAFYNSPEYQAILPIRLRTTKSNFLVTQGL